MHIPLRLYTSSATHPEPNLTPPKRSKMFQSPPKWEPPLTTSSRSQSISTIKQSKVGRSKECKGLKGRKKITQSIPFTIQTRAEWGGPTNTNVECYPVGQVPSFGSWEYPWKRVTSPQPKTGCGRSSSFIQQCRSYFYKMQMSACKATDSDWPKHRLSAWLNTHHDKEKPRVNGAKPPGGTLSLVRSRWIQGVKIREKRKFQTLRAMRWREKIVKASLLCIPYLSKYHINLDICQIQRPRLKRRWKIQWKKNTVLERFPITTLSNTEHYEELKINFMVPRAWQR